MSTAQVRRSNQERTRTTRTALLGAARALFMEKGYARTSTPEIVHAAAVTRGALYHHFADKQGLFRAVVMQEAAAVADEIRKRTANDEDTYAALTKGAGIFMTAMAEPGRARLLLLDGPAVLGQAEMERIDAENAALSLREGLEAAMATGTLGQLPLRALTNLMSAMFDRAALGVSKGDDPNDYLAAISAIFEGLRTD